MSINNKTTIVEIEQHIFSIFRSNPIDQFLQRDILELQDDLSELYEVNAELVEKWYVILRIMSLAYVALGRKQFLKFYSIKDHRRFNREKLSK